MQCYTPKEKSDFFNTSTSIATVQAIDHERQSQSWNQRQPLQQQSTSGICKCCGMAGHNTSSTGCDFTASFIMTNAYLRNNSNNKIFILTQVKEYQEKRLHNMTTKRHSLSSRIQRKANNKRIGLSPQMKLLVDAIGEEIESDINNTSTSFDDSEDLVFAVYDLPGEPHSNEFHDSCDTTHAGTSE